MQSQLKQVYQPSEYAFASTESNPTISFDGIVARVIDTDTLYIRTKTRITNGL